VCLACLSFALLPAAEPPAKPPTFIIHTAAGTPVQGTLKQIDAQGAIMLAATGAPKVDFANLISLRRTDAFLPAPPAGPQAIFAGGDRLPGVAGVLTDDRLAFTTPLCSPPETTLPLAALAVLWFADPAGLDRPDLLRRRLASERRSADVVWLRNGDKMQGTLLKLGREHALLDVAGKEVQLGRDQLAVIALNNELVRAPRPAGSYALLTLSEGARLSVTNVRSDGKTLTAQTLFGLKVQVPLPRVIALDVRQGKAVYLSDLKPTAYQYTPYLPGLTFPWVADGSAAGDDLRLGGSTYAKGLGMHSQSRLTYQLDGAYRRFEALLGLDERTGKLGRVRVRVLVDGKARDIGWDKDLTARDGGKAVRVDLTGARELTLAVEYGRLEQGQMNWADARVVK